MDPRETARAIAQTVATLAALDPEARRPLLAALYKELESAGLPEPVAASIQHQIAQAVEVERYAAPPTVATGGGITPTGRTTATKE